MLGWLAVWYMCRCKGMCAPIDHQIGSSRKDPVFDIMTPTLVLVLLSTSSPRCGWEVTLKKYNMISSIYFGFTPPPTSNQYQWPPRFLIIAFLVGNPESQSKSKPLFATGILVGGYPFSGTFEPMIFPTPPLEGCVTRSVEGTPLQSTGPFWTNKNSPNWKGKSSSFNLLW